MKVPPPLSIPKLLMSPRCRVLYEDNHVLAVYKPPGLPTMGVRAGHPSLLGWAKEYLKEKYQKPGNVYVGVMMRLDSPASGVVLLARTSKAAARLTRQFLERKVRKTYWAAVEGTIPTSGRWSDWLLHDEPGRRMAVVSPSTEGAKEARLSFRRLELKKTDHAAGWGSSRGERRRAGDTAISLVEIELETGRKHQIRLQLAIRGHAIVGDAKYGSRQAFPEGIALHARRIVFEHPVRHTAVEIEAPLPSGWRSLGFKTTAQ
jgi:23S rRNA pseudouridine1911/1915/1917 synthase